MNSGPPLRTRAPLAALLALALAPALAAQEIPSPQSVLGWDLGERFSDVAAVHHYVRVLAEASPEVTVREYGRSYEGRALLQVVLARADHLADLDRILAENAELTDPETPASRASEIIARNPGVVWFSYGVHGNESSSSEAALWTAWDLARGAEDVAGVLDSLIVVLDPVVNPDGRERYVNGYRQAAAREPDPDPRAREHREPWPGGRYNHYLFDLNRDWAWMTQVETRARLATWSRWTPLVHVDFHEMGWRSEYFFFPAARPISPIYPDHILEWGERFGAGNAEAFDREGWLYFTRQSFDLFYPGYGDSWPSLTGAIGMTYEQAGGGSAGRLVERPDGTLLSLRDRAMHHRVSGKATLRTAARGKTALMEGFARFHREIDAGFDDILLVPGSRSKAADVLAGHLLDQGIEVERAGREFRTRARTHPGYGERSRFPEGTLRVRARQPRGRLAMALLWPEHFLDAESSYDITAWALPYAYGVEAHAAESVPEAGWEPVDEESLGLWAPPGAPAGDAEPDPGARYGYLFPPEFTRSSEWVRFLEDGGRAHALADTFTLAGERYPRGTVFAPRGYNPDLEARLARAGLLWQGTGVATGLTDAGVDLGTNDRLALTLPSVALLAGEGTSPTSLGAHWHFLERKLGIPFLSLDVDRLADTGLSDLDVIVAPSGRLARVAGESGLAALTEWISDGGTLVAVDASARELGPLLLEAQVRDGGEESTDRDQRLERDLRTRTERDRDAFLEEVPGTILPAVLDPSHPLAFGAGADGSPDRTFVLSQGRVFEPAAGLEAVAYFPEGVEKVSGVISQENLDRLARGAWLVQGRLGSGRVILFADDPLFRQFWYLGLKLYANALLLAPAD